MVPGIRVDTHSLRGLRFIPPYYDSLIGKVVAYGADREEARVRMQRALDFFEIQGVDTTIPLHRKILAHPTFISGDFSTSFIDRLREEEAEA